MQQNCLHSRRPIRHYHDGPPGDRYSGGATLADFAREHDVVYKNAAEAPLRTRPPRSSLLIDGQSMGGDA
jgi:hypothetical protein